MPFLLLGFDIGGTKCAVTIGMYRDDKIQILRKKAISTDLTVAPETMLDRLCMLADKLLDGNQPERIGISCGGPLNSCTGRIQGPPNLPGWTDVAATAFLEQRYGAPARLQNDANACAVAEWKFGAGKGLQNMIFLTFGTGLGAGLILNGRLYSGTTDMAGEVGHIRLEPYGPVGYGKRGSFEGFCSGSGLAQIGYTLALETCQRGKRPLFFPPNACANDVTAKSVAEAAEQGDETAIEIYRLCGEYLGRGLSVLIDILNPEAIVIGSVFKRSETLLRKSMETTLRREALPAAVSCCKIVPAALGESLGDYAALATALL